MSAMLVVATSFIADRHRNAPRCEIHLSIREFVSVFYWVLSPWGWRIVPATTTLFHLLKKLLSHLSMTARLRRCESLLVGYSTHLARLAVWSTPPAALTKARYFVEVGERSVYGLREGMTFSIRCDYEGVAFFALAYRHRPSTQTQERVLNEITRLF